MLLKSIFTFLECAVEDALDAADLCVDMVTSVMDMVTNTVEPLQVPIAHSDFQQRDYSTKPHHTWTGEDICTRIWLQLCLSPTEIQQHRHFETLSMMQGMIDFDGDDEAWTEFLNVTPGLRAYIQDFADKYNEG